MKTSDDKVRRSTTLALMALIIITALMMLITGAAPVPAFGMTETGASTTSNTTTAATTSTSSFRCSNRLARTIWNAGFRGLNVREAWAIAMRESNGQERQVTSGRDYGLFQFNRPTWGRSSWWNTSKILTGSYNARMAYRLSKGGRDWRHWGLTGTGQTDPAMYGMWSQWQIDNWITKPYRKYYGLFPCKAQLARTMAVSVAGIGGRGAHVPVAEVSASTPVKVAVTSIQPRRDLYRGTPAQAKAEAKRLGKRYGWHTGYQWGCLVNLWNKESAWRWNSDNGDNGRTWGVPQAFPGSKMRTAGPDWRTNVTTQIRWGLRYIKSTYGSPCSAWSRWQSRAASGRYGWY